MKLSCWLVWAARTQFNPFGMKSETVSKIYNRERQRKSALCYKMEYFIWRKFELFIKYSISFGTDQLSLLTIFLISSSSFKHGFHIALTSGNFFLANASELEYENLFIFSASYCSTSKDYRLVSARWKPCFSTTVCKLVIQISHLSQY